MPKLDVHFAGDKPSVLASRSALKSPRATKQLRKKASSAGLCVRVSQPDCKSCPIGSAIIVRRSFHLSKWRHRSDRAVESRKSISITGQAFPAQTTRAGKFNRPHYLLRLTNRYKWSILLESGARTIHANGPSRKALSAKTSRVRSFAWTRRLTPFLFHVI